MIRTQPLHCTVRSALCRMRAVSRALHFFRGSLSSRDMCLAPSHISAAYLQLLPDAAQCCKRPLDNQPEANDFFLQFYSHVLGF